MIRVPTHHLSLAPYLGKEKNSLSPLVGRADNADVARIATCLRFCNDPRQQSMPVIGAGEESESA